MQKERETANPLGRAGKGWDGLGRAGKSWEALPKGLGALGAKSGGNEAKVRKGSAKGRGNEAKVRERARKG